MDMIFAPDDLFDEFFVYKLNHANPSFPCLFILYDIVRSTHEEK